MIDEEIDKKSKDILEASKNLDVLLEEKFRIEHGLIELKEGIRKAKFNLSRLREERESLQRAYWRERDRARGL